MSYHPALLPSDTHQLHCRDPFKFDKSESLLIALNAVEIFSFLLFIIVLDIVGNSNKKNYTGYMSKLNIADFYEVSDT